MRPQAPHSTCQSESAKHHTNAVRIERYFFKCVCTTHSYMYMRVCIAVVILGISFPYQKVSNKAVILSSIPGQPTYLHRRTGI